MEITVYTNSSYQRLSTDDLVFEQPRLVIAAFRVVRAGF